MKFAAPLAACFLAAFAAVHADDEKIPQIATLSGEIYKEVRLMKREGDTVTIMHSDGVKKLKYSQMDKEAGMLLGLESYQKELAAEERAKNEASAAEEQKARKIRKGREDLIERLSTKNRKEVFDWYLLYIFQDDNDLKKLFGRPANSQYGDSLVWNRACWNPTTEEMDSIWVDNSEYENTNLRTGAVNYTFKSLVFRCGDKKFEVLHASKYIKNFEDEWSK